MTEWKLNYGGTKSRTCLALSSRQLCVAGEKFDIQLPLFSDDTGRRL